MFFIIKNFFRGGGGFFIPIFQKFNKRKNELAFYSLSFSSASN